MDRILRLVARTALAGIFIDSGLRIVRTPNPPEAERAAKELPIEVPRLDLVARGQAAVQLAGGVALGIGLFPEISAGALALTLFPVTYVGHPYWKLEDPMQRRQQRSHFLKNLGLFGGLLYVATDARRHRRAAG